MRKLFALALLLTAVGAEAEFCNWGFVGPRKYKCEEQNYIFGSPICDSGRYKNIFCHEQFFADGKACSEDASEATKLCYEKFEKEVLAKQKKNTK